MTTFTASEARSALPAILDRVETGEEVTITRHGRAVAVVVGPEALRRRRISALFPEVQRARDALNAARLAEIPAEGLTSERAEKLVAEIRAGREAR